MSENPVDTADSHIPVCNHSGVYRVEAFREGETGGTVQIVRIGSPSSPAVAVLEEWRQPMRIASESDLEAD